MENSPFIPPQTRREVSEPSPISTGNAPELGTPKDIDRQVIVMALLAAEHDQLIRATREVTVTYAQAS